MNLARFETITGAYAGRRLAVVGDFCLDRYLEIDPGREEVSIETDLPVHNVVRVRSQPGGAGTILNNLVALGVGELWAVGFCGEDGEGLELRRALSGLAGVRLEHFITSTQRRTFTYCKPLVMTPGQPPRELNRLDSKNWTATPQSVTAQIIGAVRQLASMVDGIILLDQVDEAETGVLTREVLECVGEIGRARPEFLVLADSRRGLGAYPPVTFKMNRAELAALTGSEKAPELEEVQSWAVRLAQRNERPVFVTLAEQGIVGAGPGGSADHAPIVPVRGVIDIVGAGDAVTANLAAALASGASLKEAMELANAGASVVLHQLGTTGSARVENLQGVLGLR